MKQFHLVNYCFEDDLNFVRLIAQSYLNKRAKRDEMIFNT